MNIVSLVLAGILSISSAAAAQLSTATEFDNTKVPTGTVGAKYTPESEKRIKTRVQLGETDKYDYDLFGRKDYEYFPLQLGNGDYSVTIFENVTDTKYRPVKSQNVKADIPDKLLVYKASVQTVNWNKDMAVIKKAQELTKNLKTDKDKVSAVYQYVVSAISYDYDKINKIDSTYVPDIEAVIKAGKGICYDYAAVLAAMLRSLNIPTKLVKGYSSNVKEYHAWNEVYLAAEKRWMVIDTTYDSVMKKNKQSYKMEKEPEKYKMSRQY